MQKIMKDDEVIVIAGKDKGKHGRITQVVRHSDRVKIKVEHLNMVRKHVRPNPQANEQGGIVSMEAFIDASNVMIYDTATQKYGRIGMKRLEDGRKVRCYKSDGELIETEI